MARLVSKVGAGVRRARHWLAHACTPSTEAWKASTWALGGLWLFLLGSLLVHDVLPQFTLGKALALLVIAGALAIAALGVLLLARVLMLLRPGYRVALALALPLLTLLLLTAWSAKGAVIGGALLVIGLSLAAGGTAGALRKGRSSRPIAAWIALGVGISALVVLMVGVLHRPEDPNPTLAGYQLAGRTLDMADPGRPGPFKLVIYTYGGGADRYRPEFAAKANWRSLPVDGSKLDADWKGLGGMLRTAYWGFGPKAFPVQGRVWAPQGAGPFPLVLIVHGNHDMEDFSDPGYGYLGDLLASQGFILVSVDENFLNSSLSDMVDPINGRGRKENDARGWLLLEHLVQWRGWNADPAHPFYRKVDMDRIGIIGHSRGGEAVAVAAAFNKLSHDPDDATLPFNYGFKLGAVAAIAPVDGQYKARDRPTPLKDVNYFVIHGSLDGDVTSFMGSSQYARDALTGEVPAFKSSLYVKDANHNQFNTTWGGNDLGLPWTVLSNERALLRPGDQRQIAEVYLSAFLQTTLMGRTGYKPLFKDPRRGAAWLPKGYLAANYADSATAWIATFDEDLDPGTAAVAGARITGRNLSVWREADVKLKANPMDTQVALIGWDERVHAGASYAIDLGPSAGAASLDGALVFSAAEAGIDSLPEGFKPKTKPDKKSRTKAQPLDWTIVLVDAKGMQARLPLSYDQVLYPQIKGQTRAFPEIDGAKQSEVVLRRFHLPMAAFAKANPKLELGALKTLRFDFDRSKRGAIALDDVGIARGE